MQSQEAKKKNQEALKILKKEEKLLSKEKKNLEKMQKNVSELRRALEKERLTVGNKIKGLGRKNDYRNVIRIGNSAYLYSDSNNRLQHGLVQTKYEKFDLYNILDEIIPPSKNELHLEFKVGQKIKLKQEGFVPFRIGADSSYGARFYFPANIEVVREGSSHYVLGKSHPKRIKNPLVETKIMCFYKDGKALVHYWHREFSNYYEIVDLSNYESGDLNWHKPSKPFGFDFKKIDREKFPKYLKENGLIGEIEFDNKFEFRVGDVLYIKSHEIMLKNPTKWSDGSEYKHYDDDFSFLMGEKDLDNMQSFALKRSTKLGITEYHNGVWKVFGFVGDKVLVSVEVCANFTHFELFSPDEIGLLIDLKYRIAKENQGH